MKQDFFLTNNGSFVDNNLYDQKAESNRRGLFIIIILLCK